MKRHNRVVFTALVGSLLLSTSFTGKSQAQITGILSSDVEGFFGAVNDIHQQSEGPNTPPWAPTGFALPNGPGSLPNIPALYVGYPNPVNSIPTNIPFPAPAGHSPSSPFTDGITSADYHIWGSTVGTGQFTRNADVRLGNNTSNLMYLTQPPSAVGYAFEAEEFAIQYSVGAGGLLPGAPAGNRPYLIYGNFQPSGSAEFGAEVNYWFIPTNVALSGTVGFYGTPINLGSLQYDHYISNVTGPFASLVPDTFGSPNLAGATGTGILELTGDMYVIGDPVNFYVEAVPEPPTLAMFALALLGFGAVVLWRRSRIALAT